MTLSLLSVIIRHYGCLGETGPKTTELERANIALDQVNSLLMKQMVKEFSRHEQHGLYGSADNRDLGIIDDLLTISREVSNHINKQGSLERLKVELGYFSNPQQLLDSMVGILVGPNVTKEDMVDINQSIWPSRVEGLAIKVARAASYDSYNLVAASEKQFNWFEANRNA